MPELLDAMTKGELMDRLTAGAVAVGPNGPTPNPQGSNIHSACCPPPSAQCHTVGCGR